MKPMSSARNLTLRLYSPSLAILLVLIPFFSFYLKQVKVQEGLQNDRAFRMLDLIARQFSGEIDGNHKAMDAALLVKAHPQDKSKGKGTKLPFPSKCPQNPNLAAIQEYLNAYIVDKFSPAGGDSIPLAAPQKQPRQTVCEVVLAAQAPQPSPHSHSIVQFQDSRTYLELSHEGRATFGQDVRM